MPFGAVLEVEFVLAALLRRASDRVAVGHCVAADRAAELLVDENARLRLGHLSGDRRLEAVVDHLLGSGDLGR